jgi:F-type H+-transporting ATPase subunit b
MESIIKSLSFDYRFFFAQIVLFIVLTLVMNEVFWKPMLKHLAKRDQSIKDAYDTVDGMRQDMEELRAEYQARIIKVESEARSHIQQAIKEAQTERERILSDHQGITAMEKEKAEALTGLRQRMVAIATGAVEKALGKTADPRALRRSIERGIAPQA